ncbi:hypothetical protein SAMN05216388_103416 [Halorientalis persicus]|uniref:site-specific DNA-methyltransferase (adenine-specific) n=1 Tax=Halorientalis persicus TaxID=1367881 RepID=A0A1H8V822_9EURY|nr:DNA methyltransferase [Halorientalis persicus]SEP11394.1 hypothetical protein SAMN05216388_103416 [Halorientalis persicus]
MSTRRRKITAQDIADWTDLEEIMETLRHRGLREVSLEDQLSDDQNDALGESDYRFLQLAEGNFLIVIEAESSKSPSDYRNVLSPTLRTALVVQEFGRFTFISRKRSFGPEGQRDYQQYSFERSQFTGDGKKYSTLDKLNDIEGDDATSIQNLYDTREVVKEFYSEFESIRSDLIREVTGVDAEKEGEAKEQFVQVLFNRLIFLHFIQEKGLLNGDTQYLKNRHQEAVTQDESTFEVFYEPLFFKVLAEDEENYDENADIDVSFIEGDDLPYLNGGLFSKSPVESNNPDIRLGEDPKQENDHYWRILDFLDDWNWHVDERLDIVEPKNLSPEILGHIFEQTVNQKEMGAYYTPEEITDYMARKAIHPRILEDLNSRIDNQYGSIQQALDHGEEVETLYEEVLLNLKILDPAVGSGAFLLAAEKVLLDVYLECFDKLRDRYSDHTPPSDAIQAVLNCPYRNEELFAKRTIIQNNLYGVDIDDGAVEICKLRLWLSTVAQIEQDPEQVEPLPNIDFNIRDGNTLIGFIDTVEGTPDGNSTITSFSDESVDDYVTEVADLIERQQGATGSEAVAIREEIEDLMDEYRPELNERIQDRFERAGLDNVTLDEVEGHNPFHWVIEFAKVYRDGWFDVIVGNPPWDRIRQTRDDFYSDYIESFQNMMPDEQERRIDDLLNERPELEDQFEAFQTEKKRLGEYFHKSRDYELQDPEVAGRKRSTENDLSALFLERIYKLAGPETYISQILPGNIFTGLATKDLRDALLNEKTVDSIIGFKNTGIFANIHQQYKFAVVVFKNSGETDALKGIFGQPSLKILRELQEGNESRILEIPREVLADYSPIAGIFPIVKTQEQVEALNTIVQHPPVSEPDDESWYANPYRELDRTQDSDRFIQDQNEGDYPVLGGSNVYLFSYDDSIYNIDPPEFWSVEGTSNQSAKQRIREKGVRNLKSALFDLVDNSPEVREQFEVTATGSMKGTVNDLLQASRGSELSESDVKLDCTEYRIVYRDVAQPTDERTMIASVIPPGYVCHNKLHTVRPFEIDPEIDHLTEEPLHGVYERIFTDRELFAAVGMLNSIPFDYLMRTKIDKSVVMYKFRESQVPHLTAGDEWFEEIWRPAAKLNCYGELFAEMRERLGGLEAVDIGDMAERRDTQARLDAAAFHAYGFGPEETDFILNDFHRVGQARIMNEPYFELVKEHYEAFQ